MEAHQAAGLGLPQPAGLGTGLQGFMADVGVGKGLHLGLAGESKRSHVWDARHLLMRPGTPEHAGSVNSWSGTGDWAESKADGSPPDKGLGARTRDGTLTRESGIWMREGRGVLEEGE